MGPYTLDQINQYLEQDLLLPTDLAWHEGMADWVPLGQMPEVIIQDSESPLPSPPVIGSTCPQCQSPVENTETFCLNCGTRLKLDDATLLNIEEAKKDRLKLEESRQTWHLKLLGFLMIVGVILPLGGKAGFINFNFSEMEPKMFIPMLFPLIMGCSIIVMAPILKDPLRCAITLGLGLFYLVYLVAADAQVFKPLSSAFGQELAQMAASSEIKESSFSSKYEETKTYMSLKSSYVTLYNSYSGGYGIIFIIGWHCFITGQYIRGFRPENLSAHIMGFIGSIFICLNWIVPLLTMISGKFNGFVLIGLITFGLQIAAAVMCFTIPFSSGKSRLISKRVEMSLGMFLGSFIAHYLLLFLYGIYLSGDLFRGLGVFFVLFVPINKFIIWAAGTMLVVPISAGLLIKHYSRR